MLNPANGLAYYKLERKGDAIFARTVNFPFPVTACRVLDRSTDQHVDYCWCGRGDEKLMILCPGLYKREYDWGPTHPRQLP